MSDSRESIDEADDAGADDDQIQQQRQQRKKKKKKKKKKNRDGFERKLGGVKNLIMLPLRKLEKFYERKKTRPPSPPFPYSEDLGGKGCKLCFMQPRVLDSPLRQIPDVKTSSYHGFVRSFLQKNDFYSPECNVHRDI